MTYNKIKIMKERSKSVGVLQIQKELNKNHFQTPTKQFVPFIKERDLGKLITSSATPSQQPTTPHQINFKNFKKIYRRQSRLQQIRYSKITRNSLQKDLITEKGWLKIPLINLKKVNQYSQKQFKKQTGIRKCCIKEVQKMEVKKNKFEKIDQQLYKKMAKNAPNDIDNPQIAQLFSNYVKVCEFNQNIRRQGLLKK